MKNQESYHEPFGYVFSALKLASMFHGTQTKKFDNLPYIDHLIDTANILINKGQISDEDEIAAAILHDILEDTIIPLPLLMGKVSQMTVHILLLLTDDKSLPLEGRRVDTVRKLQHAGDEVKRVKLADLCSNVTQPPKGWCSKRLADYYKYTDQLAEACRDGSLALYNEYQTRRATVAH